ncbi:hypothetical protein EJ02DRAFT_455282 [Clathrospora elynae]|uniref:Uncharacterized protein n=1 Tax=Clathrospora elynae TaxID=706981 RepID=A0A6A5SWG1_9PLEO|nr:hypothetical protein EJ02DRAFT_455282 [Clathrospora elynae]
MTTRYDYAGIRRGEQFRSTNETSRASAVLRDGHLRDFLAKLHHLESLKIDLDSSLEHDDLISRLSPSKFDDVIGLDYTWTKLRKLSPSHFYASQHAFLSLLERHSSTLKDLRLRDIVLRESIGFLTDATIGFSGEDEGVIDHDWRQVLQRIAEILDLEQAKLSGLLGVNESGDEWILEENNELTAATARYLTKGGQCPLNATNMRQDEYNGQTRLPA